MPFSITEFQHIYTVNIVPAMRVAISLLGNEDDARDIVQDVFLKLWESDIGIENPQAFVIRSVRNACLDRLKSLGVKQRVRQSLRIEPLTSDEDVEERQTEVLEAVERLLTERERQIIGKVYDEGLSYKAAVKEIQATDTTTVDETIPEPQKRPTVPQRRSKPMLAKASRFQNEATPQTVDVEEYVRIQQARMDNDLAMQQAEAMVNQYYAMADINGAMQSSSLGDGYSMDDEILTLIIP